MRRLVRQHFVLVWRTLRRLGVAEADLQDAAQSVFVVVGEKLHSITTDREQSFVFGTALRVASHTRRSRRRKREASLEEAGVLWDGAPTPEEALERTQALDQLAAILNGMDEQLRSVFVLFELEQVTMIEIARLEQLPLGTVASRLRRARQYFKNATARGEAEGVA